MANFQSKLDLIQIKNSSLACVGLDCDWGKLPDSVKKEPFPQFSFNKAIIDATNDLVCAYKPNSAFYEELGSEGIRALKMTCDYLHDTYPEIPIILDAKRADIGNTNNGYVEFVFTYLRADAITLHPYLGSEALQPFFDQKDKGCIILCRTSNKGAGEFQDFEITSSVILRAKPEESSDAKTASSRSFANLTSQTGAQDDSTKEPLYKYVAKQVVNDWNKNGNCMLVVGATYPEELKEIRKIAGDMTFLVPGIGAQGGDIEATLKAGLNSQKRGLIINSSRSIIFASSRDDFAQKSREETRRLQQSINSFR